MSEWRRRERSRFETGLYAVLPWSEESWWTSSDAARDHFAHVSSEDPSKVAYTPDDTHGEADRQLRTKPGKYLKKYFGEVLSDPEIQKWASEFAEANEKAELKLATTPDEIERIYTESGRDSGVAACMSYGASDFDGPCHPTRVYGAGDLGIAFLGTYSHPKARVLVRLDPKIYGRIYGDVSRMRAALAAAGYVADTDSRGFNGARLLRIEGENGGLVGPYLDNSYAVNDHGDHLTMERGGAISAQKTNGMLEGGFEYHCANCGTGLGEDDGLSACDELYCESCYCDLFISCEKCGESVPNDDAVCFADEYFCEDCANRISFTCEKCGERESNDDGCSVGDETWCQSCWENHAKQCDSCEEWFDGQSETFETVDDDSAEWCSSCVADGAEKCGDCGEHVSKGNLRDGRCEGCADDAEAEAEAEAEADQLPLPGFEKQATPGPGLAWIPAFGRGSFWGDFVTMGRWPQSTMAPVWGTAWGRVAEIPACCICGKRSLDCLSNYHQDVG